MDRTSILGDTIDYVKELLERIQNLQQEIEVGSDQLNMVGILKDTKASELIVRNSPKVCNLHTFKLQYKELKLTYLVPD